MQSAMLRSGVDRNILASADLAMHTALMFSSGTRANTGGINGSNNTANNKKARFIQTPLYTEDRVKEPIGRYGSSLASEKGLG